MMQAEPGFDLRSCCDFGLYPAQVAAQTVFLLVTLCLGLYLISHTRRGLVAAGEALVGFVLIASFLVALSPRGVVKSSKPLAVYDPWIVRTFYFTIVAVEITSALAVIRKRRRKSDRPDDIAGP